MAAKRRQIAEHSNRGAIAMPVDLIAAVKTVAAAPDAIQLPPGTAPILQAIPGKDRPALVLRTDIANVYGTPLPKALFSEVIDEPVAQGVRLDAACVVVNLLSLPDEPEVYRQCIRNINQFLNVSWIHTYCHFSFFGIN